MYQGGVLRRLKSIANRALSHIVKDKSGLCVAPNLLYLVSPEERPDVVVSLGIGLKKSVSLLQLLVGPLTSIELP